MRWIAWTALTFGLLLSLPTLASDKGVTIRPGNLQDQPFIDAASVGSLPANQSVTILARRGAWVQVEAGGKTGWVRTLNLRMEVPGLPGTADANGKTNGQGQAKGQANADRAKGQRPGLSSLSNPTAMLRTGSSGRTVTTGVKGLDEEDIRNASPDYAQLEALNALGASEVDAQAKADAARLAEADIAYLKKGKVK